MYNTSENNISRMFNAIQKARRPEGEGFYVLIYVHFIIDLNNMTRNQG